MKVFLFFIWLEVCSFDWLIFNERRVQHDVKLYKLNVRSG